MCMSAYYASRQRQFSAARHYRLSVGGCCDDPAMAGGGPLQPAEIHLHIPYAPMGPFCSRGFGLWVKHGYLNWISNRVFGALQVAYYNRPKFGKKLIHVSGSMMKLLEFFLLLCWIIF